jgi:hypothetical protein
MRSRPYLLASICLAGIQAAFLPLHSRAADTSAELQQALGSQDPLYKYSSAALQVGVKLAASRDPAHAGRFVDLVLRSGRSDADAIAPSLVQSAIDGLGANPAPNLIADIVRDAAYATPSEVLDIVTAAVKVAPSSAAPAIVTAAVRTVPHPEQLVNVNVQRRALRRVGNDKELDNKELPPPEQKQLTLAEAIIQAALAANPSLSEDALMAAADTGLNLAFATSRPPVLTGILAPVPVLPNPPVVAAPSTTGATFSGPGPVSP